MTTSTTRGVLLALLTAVLWGGVPVVAKIALPGITGSLLSVLRLTVAATFLALLLARAGKKPWRRPPRLVLLAALGLGLNYLFYMWGVERTGPASSQVVIQSAYVFLILLGVTVLGERLSARQLAGTGAALLGVLLVSWKETEGTPASALGVTFILFAGLAWAVYAAAHKHLGRDHASGGTMMWIFLLAAAVTAPPAMVEPLRRPDAVQGWAIAFLCLNTIVAYWAFAESLRHIPATTAAVIGTLAPVVTLGLMVLTNHLDQDRVPYEPITFAKILGALLVMLGVGVAVTTRRRLEVP